MLLRFFVCCLVVAATRCVSGQVVINEVFYHSPDDVDRLEWIELNNTGKTAVDVSGWTLTGGLQYTIPNTTIVEPDQYLVICKDTDLFGEFYDVPALGGFDKSIGNSGDTIELRNNSHIIDSVTFTDRAPWPVAADGYGASLERITPTAPSESGNWAASELPERPETPGGTPGKRNANYSSELPPEVSKVVVVPQWPAPGNAISVSCTVKSRENLGDVELLYQVVHNGKASEEVAIPMPPNDEGNYTGSVPGQDAGALVRIRIRATDDTGAQGVHPSPGLRPATSIFVMKALPTATVPMAHIINADPEVAGELQQASKGTGQGIQARMMQSRMRMILTSVFALEDAWIRLMLDGEFSQEKYQKLRVLFQEQMSKREQLAESAGPIEDMQSAMKEMQKVGTAATQDFQKLLEQVLGAAGYAEYQKRAAAPRDGSDQFLKQMLPVERLWLAIENQFESSAEQRVKIRNVIASSLDDRKKELLPLLAKLQTGNAGFEDVQAAAGELESAMWASLKPALSFRQNRFARGWYSKNTSMMGVSGGKDTTYPRGASAFVYIDTSTGEKQVFDFIDVRPRSAGYKIRFHKDKLFHGMSTANIIFEVQERFVLAEPLAFDLYRRVGSPACLTDFVRLHIDDNVLGYHLLFEQPNRAFLRRNGRNTNGDLYKLLWYGKGTEGKYEVKTPKEYGHAKLLDLIRQLDEASGEEQWAVIQKEINVDQVINYFVVNMCLSHWDGFFNNYFAFHDVEDSGKWELYPWDQDKTWGFHDGTGPNEVFTNLPLTFGMQGDTPPGGGPQQFARSWWRPGGEFSKPLLANAQFRERFLARLHTVLTTVYTEEVYFPIIDSLAERLQPEVNVRAETLGQDPDKAQAQLATNIGLLKEHLTKRRAFLLEQDELQAVAE